MSPPAVSRLATLHRSLGISAAYRSTHGLKRQREATRLVRIGKNPAGRVLRLSPKAAAAWKRLHAAAARDGIALLPISAFRSISRQAQIIRAKLARGQPLDAILRLVAAPGHSEHHTGRALDLGTPGHAELDRSFARTAAFRWLIRQAGDFGFRLSYPRANPRGIAYEPWHWCWHP